MKKLGFSLLLLLGAVFTRAEAFGFGYAAIAYSPSTGLYGWSSNVTSPWHVNRAALANCGAWDCQLAVSVTNACGALAVGFGNAWGTGVAYNRYGASSIAVGNCSAYGPGCRLYAFACAPGF